MAHSSPTTRVMVVCVPERLPHEAVAGTRSLRTHFGVEGTCAQRLWARSSLSFWQRRKLFHPRGGRPDYCAGGPLGLLDLDGTREAAAMAAAIRHERFSYVVHGTRPATPWSVFAARHEANPSRHPLDKLTAEFDRQPRVVAMRLHNAAAGPDAQLPVGELEAFQAGSAAYQNYHALWATCTDALLTAEGARLQPASDRLVDQVEYLSKATRYLESLDYVQRLLVVEL